MSAAIGVLGAHRPRSRMRSRRSAVAADVELLAEALRPPPSCRLLCDGTLMAGASRAWRRAPCASMARSTAAVWPAMTTCPGELKLTASHHLRLPRLARARSDRPPHRRARARRPSRRAPGRHGFLHQLAASAGRGHRRAEVERARGDQRRELAEAVTEHDGPGRDRRVAPRAPRRDACGQHRGLRALGGIERFGRTFAARAARGRSRAPSLASAKVCPDDRIESRPAQPSMPTECEPWPGNTKAMVIRHGASKLSTAAHYSHLRRSVRRSAAAAPPTAPYR